MNAKQATDGLLLVDKPEGPTSHGVVSIGRRLLGTRKVGHGGTLDPMATGVLVLGVGKGTKLLTYVSGSSKQYEATIRLGQSTDTDDAMGSVLTAKGATEADIEGVEREMGRLTGDIIQVPSTVSAIKVDGKRAYDLVRKGETVELQGRPVTVSRFEMIGDPRPVTANVAGQSVPVQDVDVVADVSSGTYIRALARDLGEALGVGGHLTALRRTKAGVFDEGECTTLAELEAKAESGELLPVLPLSDAARTLFPGLRVNAAAEKRFRHGAAPKPRDVVKKGIATPGQEPAVYAVVSSEVVGSEVVDADEELLGLVEGRGSEGDSGIQTYKTLAVFAAQ